MTSSKLFWGCRGISNNYLKCIRYLTSNYYNTTRDLTAINASMFSYSRSTFNLLLSANCYILWRNSKYSKIEQTLKCGRSKMRYFGIVISGKILAKLKLSKHHLIVWRKHQSSIPLTALCTVCRRVFIDTAVVVWIWPLKHYQLSDHNIEISTIMVETCVMLLIKSQNIPWRVSPSRVHLIIFLSIECCLSKLTFT